MDTDHKHHNEIVSNPKFRAIKDKIPQTESLETTMLRVVPFWNSTIVPDIKSGKRVLVVCHGTSLRGIVKHVERELTACCYRRVQWRRVQGMDWSSETWHCVHCQEVTDVSRSLLPPAGFSKRWNVQLPSITQHLNIDHRHNQHMYNYIASHSTLTSITVNQRRVRISGGY